MAANGHRATGSVSQIQNHKAQLASAYNELGKELSSQKIRVIGNYTLGRVIGEGTYGKVRLGIHRPTGTKVAIKQIPKAMSSSLTREIHHHRQLHYPYVTQLFEVIATESHIWLITELCSGGELFDYLAEKGRLAEDEARTLFGQLCLAVAYVHEKGIVHRDLKLENVLLDERCRVKLGDFGFTREFEKGILLETFCGTTGYASPEMLLAKKYLGPEVDVWSLGVILYTLLTGTLPFDDDDETVMRDKVIKGEFEDPEWLSNEARDLIKNILIVDPTKRLTIAQILAHSWFTVSGPTSSLVPSSPPGSPTRLSAPSMGAVPQLTNTTSVTSNATFHSASCESFPTTPQTPDDPSDDPFSSSATAELRQRQSELTLRKLTANERKTPTPDTLVELPDHSLQANGDVRPSLSRATTTSNASTKGPPSAFPTRTPARTKRRSVSSTLSTADAATNTTFDISKIPSPPQDFSSLLSTPAPIIFSTPLERDLLNSLSSLGFDTGQIVHSVLTDACDATGALWWMLKRKAEKKSLEEGIGNTIAEVADTTAEQTADVDTGSGDKEKDAKSHAIGRSSPSPLPALASTRSAPELQFIPPTPTAAKTNTRSSTPPRSKTPTSGALSPTPSLQAQDAVRSHPSTPGGSLKERDKDSQGSKGRKNRAGSVSIMQRATTALEAAGLVRKKSAEAVRDDKEREKSSEKRMGSGDEPRISGGSNKLAKSPPLRALKDISIPSTPNHSFEQPASAQVGSPWVITNGKLSPPLTPGTSPGDTLGALPNIAEHGKLGQHRNRASLLSAFRMWFKEDPKGKRKEQPTLSTQGLSYGNGPTVGSPGSSPVNGRGRGTVKQRNGTGRGKFAAGRKTNPRTKRASMSSRRSSSVNSKRSSITSTQFAILEGAQYSPDQMAPMSRQRSDPSRSKGSRTPNSERDEYVSRPSSMQSFHHRHHKSPSASSSGSIYPGRASPLPKYHRRAGSGSSTRVVRQIPPSTSMKSGGSHLRSNSASSNHSLASSRHGSLYDLSETEGRRASPNKTPSRNSFDETPRRAATFVAQKRQTPFAHPISSGYLNSLGRSSWKKSWGMEPPGWQTRSAFSAVEVLAVSDGPGSIRDVFTGRQSMGDESDWIDEDDDMTGYVGGLGQMTTSSSAPTYLQTTIDSPMLPTMSKPPPLNLNNRTVPSLSSSTKHHPTLPTANVNSRQGRGKSGGRSPAGRSSPLPGEAAFDSSGRRTQLPAGRSGPAAIQEEDEDEEED
ncbi:hypothetical protein BXZ70DRAFT_716753 [Cristinia sonorae]|uniref:Protein kinase domain-containing protein n=1 Tax=Cristinia sonorae TaxID=1940300 RepID=A0A8K0XS11_9AGAR|nr:hypothetical protein BXZ70DRAFT_716753 [Cristinia sonorae]